MIGDRRDVSHGKTSVVTATVAVTTDVAVMTAVLSPRVMNPKVLFSVVKLGTHYSKTHTSPSI